MRNILWLNAVRDINDLHIRRYTQDHSLHDTNEGVFQAKIGGQGYGHPKT
jgi:hypothetical protein